MMASVGGIQPRYTTPVANPYRNGATPLPAPRPTASPSNNPGAYDIYRLVPSQDHQSRLFRFGIDSPGKLRFWGGGPIRRFFSSMFTGIPNNVMKAYAQEADLMRIPGTTADAARLLYEVGIRSPLELGQYAGDDIGSKIQRGALYAAIIAKSIELAANEGRAYSPPTFDDLGRIAMGARGLNPGVT